MRVAGSLVGHEDLGIHTEMFVDAMVDPMRTS
jgi:hypothetical protein